MTGVYQEIVELEGPNSLALFRLTGGIYCGNIGKKPQLIHNGKPPAPPGDSPRFDLCDGRKKYFPPPGRGRARVGVEALVVGISRRSSPPSQPSPFKGEGGKNQPPSPIGTRRRPQARDGLVAASGGSRCYSRL